jgi:hypothetical protein
MWLAGYTGPESPPFPLTYSSHERAETLGTVGGLPLHAAVLGD